MTARCNFRSGSPLFFAAILLVSLMLMQPLPARAEYGDVVLNNRAEKSGMRPVIFPHWFHRIRFNCKICHSDLGFKFQAGGNDINMLKIINGDYCGACHNGVLAWSVKNCNLCHSGKRGTTTRVHEDTTQDLIESSSPSFRNR